MTMVLPSQYDVVDNHRHLQLCTQQQQNQIVQYSNAVVYGGEIDSIRRRSTSLPNHCIYFNSSDPIMADELIRPDQDPNQPSSSSLIIDPTADENWLNLRLGSDNRQTSSSTLDTRHSIGVGGSGGSELIELDLLPATTHTSHRHLQQQLIRSNTTRPPGFFHQPPRPASLLHRIPVPELNWCLIRSSGNNYYMSPNPTASNSMSLMPMGPNFFSRPNFDGATQMENNGGGDRGMTSSSSGMRIIRQPRRSNVGIWFMLLAWQNQIRDPFLPQIAKSYLRIKNGQMTIRLLMKYLVQKLGLESESEVEIRCRGQELEPILTLQHVRDSIWCTRPDTFFNLHADSTMTSSTSSALPNTDSHIMILHYARPVFSAAAAAATNTGTALSASMF